MAFRKFAEWANRYSEKISLVHVIIFSLLFAAVSIIYHHGGMLHPEMNTRLPFYLADKPLLNKIFDSRILDSNLFRARELSYLLDFFDSKFIEFSIRSGFPHFLSLEHYLFCIAISCLIWLFCVKDLKLRPLIGAGWLILFWTSPSIFLGGDMFRDAKIGVAFLTALLFRMVYKVTVKSKEPDDTQFSIKFWLVYFIAIFSATFLDEQGLYLNIMILVFLSLWIFFIRNKNVVIMLFFGTASLLLHLAYRYFIAPQLTYALNGYWPNFSYQRLPFQNLLRNMVYYISSGFFLFVETLRSLIGSPPLAAGYVFLLLFILFPIFILYTQPDTSPKQRKFFILVFIELLITNFIMIVAMNILMVLRARALMSPDVELVYYWLPTNVLLAMTLIILTAVFQSSRIPKWILAFAMCLAIAGNIAALPNDKKILTQGRLQVYYETSPQLLNAFENLNTLDTVQNPVIRANPVFIFFSGDIGLKFGIK